MTDRQLQAFPAAMQSVCCTTRSLHTRLNLATRLMVEQLKNEMNRFETIVYTSVSVRYAFGLQAEPTAVCGGACNVGSVAHLLIVTSRVT